MKTGQDRFRLSAAILLGSSILAIPAFASPTPVTVTLEEVVKKVSTENYTVYGNALRVYQAREAVQVARMNLLPRLNLWRLAGSTIEVVLGGASGNAAGVVSGVLGVVED